MIESIKAGEIISKIEELIAKSKASLKDKMVLSQGLSELSCELSNDVLDEMTTEYMQENGISEYGWELFLLENENNISRQI